MKKVVSTLILTVSVFFSILNAQVGISNSNPQGRFHVDGAKDNPATGVPSPAQQANDVVVTNNGNVGIGTTTPVSKLNIINGRVVISAAANPALPLNNGWHDFAADAGTGEGVIVRLVNTSPVAAGNTSLIGFNAYNGGGAAWGLGTRQITAAPQDSKFLIGWSNGGVYYERLVLNNSGSLTLNGDITIGGANAIKPGGGPWTATSDLRVKKDINPYTDGLKQLLQIKPVIFKYNGKGDTKDDNKSYIGVIAQDIQKVAPYAVTESDVKVDNSGKGMLQLTDSGSFTYMTINAIKEQQAMIDSLQKEILELKKLVQQHPQSSQTTVTKNK